MTHITKVINGITYKLIDIKAGFRLANTWTTNSQYLNRMNGVAILVRSIFHSNEYTFEFKHEMGNDSVVLAHNDLGYVKAKQSNNQIFSQLNQGSFDILYKLEPIKDIDTSCTVCFGVGVVDGVPCGRCVNGLY